MQKRNKKNESPSNRKNPEHMKDVKPQTIDQPPGTVNESESKETYSPKANLSHAENSMKITSSTSFGLDSGDESFLEMERQCQLEERRQRMLEAEANNTCLLDIEPPPELWEDSIVAQIPVLQNLRDDDDSVQLSPMRMVGLLRPSTIVEETSSQCNSTGENSTNKNVSENSLESKSSKSPVDASSSENSIVEKISPLKLVQETPPPPKQDIVLTASAVRKRRETLMLMRRQYKFFDDENNAPSSPLPGTNSPRTPPTKRKDLISFEKTHVSEYNTPGGDQFNDTIERVEYFMKRGQELMSPQAKSIANRTVLDTPMFSCKRTRKLNEIAAAEMQPIPKRGPLFDFSSPPDTAVTPRK